MVALNRDAFFLVTSTMTVICSFFAILPLLGRALSYSLFYNALLSAFAALMYPVYYRNVDMLKAQGARVTAQAALSSNNFQLALFCLFWFFSGGGPSAAQLMPVALPAAVQAIVVACKIPALKTKIPGLQKVYERLHAALPQLLASSAMLEIVPFFLLLLRMRIMNAILYAQYLRLRLQCQDKSVYRIGFPQGHTVYFYHYSTWQRIGGWVDPLLSRVPPLRTAVAAASNWFLGRR